MSARHWHTLAKLLVAQSADGVKVQTGGDKETGSCTVCAYVDDEIGVP